MNETIPPQSPLQKSLFNLTTAQQLIQLVITVASVVIVLVGLWLTTKLSPLAQDIALVKQASAEQDRRIEDMKDDIIQIKINTDQTKSDVSVIKGILQGNSSTGAQSSQVITPTKTIQPESTPVVQNITYETTVVEEKKDNPNKPEKPDPKPEPSPIIKLINPILGFISGEL